MVRRKKTKEDRISQLPDSLIHEILSHLPIKDAVRTSVMSTTWRNHWHLIPRLDIDTDAFQNANAFVSFVEKFVYSNKEAWIRKLQLRVRHNFRHGDIKFSVGSWIEALIMRMIQYLHVEIYDANMPLSLYTCETLVHLQLAYVTLPIAEFVFLPCLKMMHLDNIRCPNEATLEKLISGSPILDDLVITSYINRCLSKVVQIRSLSLTRIYVDMFQVEIDAPLLQCFSIVISAKKNYKIVNLGSSTRLDLNVAFCHETQSIRDILIDISKVRDLVIRNANWEDMLCYSESKPLFQFQFLSRLHAKHYDYYLKMLPTILESCPILESLILEMNRGSMCYNTNRGPQPKAKFSTVPQCLVSSLKFVELLKYGEKRRLISRYEGEVELIRYLLKNSRNLEKLKLNISLTKKVKCDFLKELSAMQICSSVCEVVVV